MPAVELQGVTKKFGKVTAAENVNLKIEDKEYITILGPSGCGKTTLLKIIAGILEPTDGKVFVDGKCVNHIPMDERDLGYVFQNIALFPHLNVWDNVTYAARVKDWSPEETRKVGNENLNLVGFLGKENFLPVELSGGASQKVGLARALSTDAKLLLLDEPLSALDARVRLELRYVLRRLVKDMGLTAIHVTHDQEEALSISDRVVVMRAGKIVEINTPQQLYNNPENLFTVNFVGESNFIEGIVSMIEKDVVLVELKGGTILTLWGKGFEYGEAVILIVRPENVELRSGEKILRSNTLNGKIDEIIFMGGYVRYLVEAEGEKIIVDIPVVFGKNGKKFNIGENVILTLNERNVLIYKKPQEGLTEVLKLE